jgi:Dyp-type peroxidase family
MTKNGNNRSGPTEPVLEMNDIQGMAVPGFLKPHNTLVGLELPAAASGLAAFRRKLAALVAELSTAAETLEDRRRHRMRENQEALAHHALVGLAFSYPALDRLAPDAGRISSPAFRLGLAARSRFLGDPTDPSSEGHFANWIFGSDPHRPTLLLAVAADKREDADLRTEMILKGFRSSGCALRYRENGDIRPDMPGHEHFGFVDGISQPGIRGRASDAPDDFITPRHIAPDRTPETWLFGYPGQDLVWPGEFVLGYPVSGPNPLQPGPVQPCDPEWTRNGSFLVFRRLRQDVARFWKTMHEHADSLKRQPGFAKLNAVSLASMLVGRWPGGAPRSRVDKDNNELGADPLANNYFRFDSACKPLPLAGGKSDPFPPAKPDPLGLACPNASHIRKLNTRDSASDMGGRETTFHARILRTGIPFGPPLMPELVSAAPQHDAANGNRGLLFLCLQASIEGQFEFLQSRWMNDPSRPRLPGGHDLLVGQNPAPREGRVRRATIFGRGFKQADLKVSTEWIIPTGGGYFFVPSISAVKRVLAR